MAPRPPRYKKNPKRPNCQFNKEPLTDETTLYGPEYEQWTKPLAEGMEPLLIKVPYEKDEVPAVKDGSAKGGPPAAKKKASGASTPPKPAPPPEDDEDEEWVLTDISGVGEARADALDKAGYEDVDDVAEADAEEMADDIGCSISMAEKIIKGAKELLK